MTMIQRIRTFLVLLTAITAVGCGKSEADLAAEREAAARAAAKEANARMWAEKDAKQLAEARKLVVGKWAARMGKPADGFYSDMSLDVRADATFTLVNAMHRPGINGNPAQPSIVNTSEGSWEVVKDELVLTLLRSPDGRPIDPEKREYRLAFFSSEQGQRISFMAHDYPKGAQFRRQ